MNFATTDFATTDLCDEYEERPGVIQVAQPLLRHFGGRQKFTGRIATLKVFEDNQLVRDAVAEDGTGKVLVVDGGGSLRSALVGDVLAKKAADNGWAGIIVFGAIRDSAVVGTLPLGVMALGLIPQRSPKKGEGARDVAVRFADVTFTPGHYLYADEDGIIVASKNLIAQTA